MKYLTWTFLQQAWVSNASPGLDNSPCRNVPPSLLKLKKARHQQNVSLLLTRSEDRGWGWHTACAANCLTWVTSSHRGRLHIRHQTFHTKNTDVASVFRKWVGSDYCNGVSHCGGGPSARDQQGRSDNETQRRQIINWSNYLELLASFSPGYYMLCRLKPLVSLLPSRRHVPHGLSLWSSLSMWSFEALWSLLQCLKQHLEYSQSWIDFDQTKLV